MVWSWSHGEEKVITQEKCCVSHTHRCKQGWANVQSAGCHGRLPQRTYAEGTGGNVTATSWTHISMATTKQIASGRDCNCCQKLLLSHGFVWSVRGQSETEGRWLEGRTERGHYVIASWCGMCSSKQIFPQLLVRRGHTWPRYDQRPDQTLTLSVGHVMFREHAAVSWCCSSESPTSPKKRHWIQTLMLF